MTQRRTSDEVEANYLSDLQRFLSCVTLSVISAETYQPAPVPHSVTMNSGDPVLLLGDSRLSIAFYQHYTVEDSEQGHPLQVSVRRYSYEIHDADGKEVLLYHWHPDGNSRVKIPHLHLEQGAKVGRTEVRDAHLPTGEVSFNAFLRMLIEEMGVRELRTDWVAILGRPD